MPWGRRAGCSEREKTEEKSSSSHEAAVWFAQESRGWRKVGERERDRERDYRNREKGKGSWNEASGGNEEREKKAKEIRRNEERHI